MMAAEGVTGQEGEKKVLSASIEFEENFFSALQERSAENYLTAILYLKRCQEADSTVAAVHHELAKNFANLSDFPMAEKAGKKAATLDSGNKWYHRFLVNIFLKQRKYQDAAREMEAVVALDSNALLDLSGIYFQAQRYEDCLESLETVEKRNGISEQIVLLKKDCYVALKKYKKAIEELDIFLNYYPNSSNATVQKAYLYYENKQKDKAYEVLSAFRASYPEDALINMALIRFYIDNERYDDAVSTLYVILSSDEIYVKDKVAIMRKLLAVKEEHPEYEAQFEQSIQIVMEKHPDDYDMNVMLGQYYQDVGNKGVAVEFYRHALKFGAPNQYVQNQLLILEAELLQIDHLYTDSKSAIEKFPEQPLAYLLNGFASISKEQYDEAVDVLEQGKIRAVTNTALLAEFYSYLGEAYYRIGDYEKSDDNYQNAIKLVPDNSVAINNYSYYLALRGARLEEAKELMEGVLRAEPNNATYLDTYAWVLFQQKSYQEALEVMLKVISQGNASYEVLDHYGDILYRNNQKQEARKQWKEALKKGGDKMKLEKKIKNGLQD